MISSQEEYNQMLSDQAQYEAEVAIRMDYENMLRQDAVQFLTEFYKEPPNHSPEAENLIVLICSAFEWADNLKNKNKNKN